MLVDYLPNLALYEIILASVMFKCAGGDRKDDDSLALLGADQLLGILLYLPIQAVISFGMTCKRYRALADTDALWAVICKREWGSRAVEAWPLGGRQKVGWKKIYRQMFVLGAAAWHRVHQGNQIPPSRASHTMSVLDGVITMFGGGCDGGRHLDDTWVAKVPEQPSDGLAWQQIVTGLPNGRFGQSSTLVRDTIVLFGGINDKGMRMCDTWLCNGTTVGNEGRSFWQLLEVVRAPHPRGAHSGCYAGERKLVVFGGIGSTGQRLGDTWMLDLADTPHCWNEVVTPFSPCARSGHTLTWVGGKRMILFGGRGVDFEVMNDVWLLDMESEYPSWVEIQSCKLHPVCDYPSPRAGHSATLIFGGRILIFGGEDSKRARKGDIWVLDHSVRHEVSHNMSCSGAFSMYRSTNSSNSRFSRKLWRKLKQRGRPPGKRSFHGACSVHSGHVILIFGGMVDGDLVPAAATGLGFDSEAYMLQLVP